MSKEPPPGPTLPLDGAPDDAPRSTAERRPSIDHYRLLQRLGQGGMGEVWEALQLEPVRRKVALKLIKRGMDSEQVVARFEGERQALALMDHPTIAKVFDAGVTERGRPYFVMEHVPGVSITEFCDGQRLDTDARLRLFVQVCHGVQHAHQKAIIHRDIKPGNILVSVRDSEAAPKIIDFGVAKAMGSRLTDRTMHTELGQLIGTPEYMSPEQAEMSAEDVDTRTDVYSLGAVLYELLIGAVPFDPRLLRASGYQAIRRVLMEQEPSRPSTRLNSLDPDTSVSAARARGTEPVSLARELRGDLDWITMKALEKDRTRRYGSPNELAADIERHLALEPVEAGPPSTLYRMGKFVRRHQVGVGSLVAVLLLLIALATTMTVQAGRIARERDRANREAETARQIASYLKDLFRLPDPQQSHGDTITAREILDDGAASVRVELAGQPGVQADLMETIGEVYTNLGLYDEAGALFDDAAALRRQVGREDPESRAYHLAVRCRILSGQGRYREAEGLAREALAISREIYEPDDDAIASALQRLAIQIKDQGRLDEAEPLYREALEHRRRHIGEQDARTASTMTSLAELLRHRREFAEAESVHRQALEIGREVHGDVHPEVSSMLNNLALVLQDQERFAEAEPLLREVADLTAKLYGPEGGRHAAALNNLAALLRYTNPAEAEPMHRRALAIRREVFGTNHPEVAMSLNNLAVLLTDSGRVDEAKPMFREAIAINRVLLGNDHPNVGVSLYNLGRILYRHRDFDDAAQVLRESLPIIVQSSPAGHWRPGNVRSMIGRCLAAERRFAEAEALVLEGYETVRAGRGDDDRRTIAALKRVIEVYDLWDRPAQAERYRRRLPEPV